MRRIVCLILIAVMIAFSGCAEPDTAGEPDYQTYRDIPGVTQAEIDAIESLKAERGGFSYGHLVTTEAFMLEDGTYAGFAIEVCKLLSGLFETEFSPVVYSEWSDLKNDIDNCITDFSGDFTHTVERMQYYEMSKPIAGRGLNIYTLTSKPEIKTETDVNGMRVGFFKNTVAAGLVTELYSELDFEIVDVPAFPDVSRMLLADEIDAFVMADASDTMFEGYDYIRGKNIFQFAYAPVSITTNDHELKPIIDVINKYLDAGGMDTMFRLASEGSYEYKKRKLSLSFTEEERAYLADLKQRNIKVNAALQHDAYPASFYNTVEKRYDGAAYDILTEVSALTGIEFNSDCMPVEKPLSDILAKLKSGEVSMMPQLLYSESRKDDYIWSGISYITTNYALLSKSEYPNLQPFQVYYATVGTVNKSAHAEVFAELFPGHEKTIVYQTGDEGFDALENGEIDLLMLAETMLLVQTNYREKLGYKVNITFNKTLDTLFGYNKDEVILRDIIDKTMSYIDVEGIEESWLSRLFDYQRKMLEDMTPFIILFVISLLAALFVVIVFYIKNRQINKNLEGIVAERTSELEHANRAKSDFLSRMSHEIRTPLTTVIGMIGIAEGTDDMEKITRCLERADNASTHLLGIINDILDMSKIEADKFELDSHEFDFEKLLISITNVTNFRAEEKHQNFIVNLNANVPAYIVGDDLRLAQVITNLLTNAVKFTPENGVIRLNIEKTDEMDDELILKISVEDNGIGISKEQQSRLFTLFEQADGGTARKFGGTGLGLAISKRIVELMGGSIWIESELGAGAKFIFTIKAHKGKEKARQELSAQIDKSKLRILMADASPDTREYFIHSMEALGLSSDTAGSSQEVLYMTANAGNTPYNLFFIDWQIPGMDSIELTKQIRAQGSQVVFIIPAAGWDNIGETAMSAGVKTFVSKPLFPSALITAINKCFSSEQPGAAGGTHDLPSGKAESLADHSILIAEDIEINREIMSAILESTGVSIDFAENGQIAVSMFRDNPGKYSLIFMDVNMPEMDGYAATQNIRALEAANPFSVPIIAMTANVFREDIERCLEAGMNDHVGKPLDVDIIMEKLRMYLLPRNPS